MIALGWLLMWRVIGRWDVEWAFVECCSDQGIVRRVEARVCTRLRSIENC